MRLFLAVTLVALCALLVPAARQPAYAQAVIARITPEAFAQAMTQAGFKAEVLAGQKGAKYIKMQIPQGAAFVDFYNCTAQGCTAANIYGFGPDRMSVDIANKFNSTSLFGTAFIDGDGTLMISMTTSLDGGVTLKHLQDEAGKFVLAIENMLKLLP